MGGLSIAWLIFDSWLTYHQHLDRAWRTADRLALVAQEQAERALHISDLVAERVIDMSREHGLEWFLTEEGYEQLQAIMLGMVPQIGGIWILDADLEAVATTVERDVPRDSFADRPYFQRVRDGARMTIGEFTYGRVSGVWFFSYNRRITADGEFLGVVQTSMYADAFGDFYQSLQFEARARVGIFGDDGGVVLYWPWTEETPPAGVDTADFPEPSGRVETVDDNGDRLLIVYRWMDRLPLVVTAGVSRSDALLPFRVRLLRTAGLVFAGLAVMVGLAWATLHANARERESASRTRRILDNLFTFVGVLTPDGTLIDTNEAPLRAGGLTLDEVQGRKLWDCYWWSHDPGVQARLRDAVDRVSRGEVVRYDVPMRTAEEGRIMVDFQMAPLRNAEDRITHLIQSASDITARVQGERRQRLLMKELNHRVKNILAVVQALARFSFPKDRAASSAFTGRLLALGSTHDLLAASAGEPVELMVIVEGVVRPLSTISEDRFSAQGPLVTLPPRLAQTIGLALYELITNAMKYGAWSVPEGRIDLEWHRDAADPGKVTINWVETGGPEVQAPTRKGFGTIFFERVLADEGAKVTVDYLTEGLRATIVLPLPQDTDGGDAQDDVDESGSSALAPEGC